MAQQPALPVIGFLCGGTEAGPLRYRRIPPRPW
jgi:hypothetical protein